MPDGSLDGERVASPETIERCQRGRVVRQRYLDGGDEEYGYGWMRHPLLGDERVGHSGSIAVATGEAPTAEPAFALEAKCEAVTGTYESFRETVTATVERERGDPAVTLSGPWGEGELTAFPESLDPAEHTSYTVSGDGAREPVEFDLEGDRADLIYARSRFRRA